jgi:transcription elongation factor GreA
MLKHARIVEITTIKIRYLAKNLVKEFQVCGSETDPFAGKICNESPLAKAVLGHKAADHVFMTTETGKDMEIEVIEIKK